MEVTTPPPPPHFFGAPFHSHRGQKPLGVGLMFLSFSIPATRNCALLPPKFFSKHTQSCPALHSFPCPVFFRSHVFQVPFSLPQGPLFSLLTALFGLPTPLFCLDVPPPPPPESNSRAGTFLKILSLGPSFGYYSFVPPDAGPPECCHAHVQPLSSSVPLNGLCEQDPQLPPGP